MQFSLKCIVKILKLNKLVTEYDRFKIFSWLRSEKYNLSKSQHRPYSLASSFILVRADESTAYCR